MKVGVTGADGFTGRYLLAELARRGYEPVAMSANLTDAVAVAAEVASIRADAVIHLAGRAFVAAADYAGFYAVNQVGTFNLLTALAAHTPGIAVLLPSSAQVYGDQATGLVRETAPLRPSNHYALSKTAMEMGCKFWAEQLRITVVRPFNYTGVGQQTRYLIPKLVKCFQRRESVAVLGNIDVQRDFGDVRSVVEAYCDLIERNPAGPLNVSTGVVTSVREVLATLSAMTGHIIEVQVDPSLIRRADVRCLGGDNSLLLRTLPNWYARSLEETLAWLLAN